MTPRNPTPVQYTITRDAPAPLSHCQQIHPLLPSPLCRASRPTPSTLSNGKRPSVGQNTRPSTMRFFGALNMPLDMPKFCRPSADFLKARPPLPLPLLICPFALLRANILIPRSMTTAQCARAGVQVGVGYMIFRHTRMEQ